MILNWSRGQKSYVVAGASFVRPWLVTAALVMLVPGEAALSDLGPSATPGELPPPLATLADSPAGVSALGGLISEIVLGDDGAASIITTTGGQSATGSSGASTAQASQCGRPSLGSAGPSAKTTDTGGDGEAES